MCRTILLIFVLFLSVELIDAQNGGYALKFDGVNDYVSVPDNPSLDFTEFTIEMWVYHTKSGVDQKIIGNADESNPRKGFCLGISDADKLYPEIFNNNSSTNVVSSETIPLNEWVHIAMSWKKGNNADGIKGFINGKQVISTSTGDYDMNSFKEWIIGSAPWFREKYYQGKIDEIRIWNTVRTEAEIKANMYKELAGNETNLVAYYKMSDGSGTILTDNKTSGTNTGTLTNGPTWIASGCFAGSRNALDFDGNDDYVDCGTSLTSG